MLKKIKFQNSKIINNLTFISERWAQGLNYTRTTISENGGLVHVNLFANKKETENLINALANLHAEEGEFIACDEKGEFVQATVHSKFGKVAVNATVCTHGTEAAVKRTAEKIVNRLISALDDVNAEGVEMYNKIVSKFPSFHHNTLGHVYWNVRKGDNHTTFSYVFREKYGAKLVRITLGKNTGEGAYSAIEYYTNKALPKDSVDVHEITYYEIITMPEVFKKVVETMLS